MALQIVNVQQQFSSNPAVQTLKMLIAGPPGAGKTLLSSTFPEPLYADIEGRLISVRHRDVRAARIETLAELEELKHMLDQPDEVRTRLFSNRPVRTIVLDTVDELARIIQAERKRTERVEALRMADWGVYGDTLRNILRGFRNIADLNVIFTTHIKPVTDEETGRVEYKPDIAGAVGNEIAGYVDEALLLVGRPMIDPNGDRVVKRYLQTYPDLQHDWVKDHSGCLPLEFPVNFTDDYNRLAELIFTDRPDATPKSVPVVETLVEEPSPNGGKVVTTSPPTRKRGGREMRAPVADVPLPEVIEPVSKPESATVVEEPQVEAVHEERTELPEAASAEEPDVDICSVCQKPIDNPDIAEISEVRFSLKLCAEHFSERVRNSR